MGKKIKVEFKSRAEFEAFNRVWHFQGKFYNGDRDQRMLMGIVRELAGKFLKKTFSDQQKYSFTLKEYEAIALLQYLEVFYDQHDLYSSMGEYEKNEVRSKLLLLDQKTV